MGLMNNAWYTVRVVSRGQEWAGVHTVPSSLSFLPDQGDTNQCTAAVTRWMCSKLRTL